MEQRLEFHDPLCEIIVFQRGLPTAREYLIDREQPLDPRDLVQTVEFSRLAFLRQAELAWLAFPSAAHTRFSHSIACWWLGRVAESLMKVKTWDEELRVSRTIPLHKWLEDKGVREEFYLALLLGGIGHGPFSHVLERNESFRTGLKKAGIPEDELDHAHRGVALLRGKTPLADVWTTLIPDRYGNEVHTVTAAREHLDKVPKVCMPAVYYLMTDDENYLDECRCKHHECLNLLAGILGGVLDLDRLDLYARDTYFAGLKQVSFNLRSFLSSITIEAPTDGNPLTFFITPSGASYAVNLLFGKRQIESIIFRNPKTVAFQAMLDFALTTHIASKDDQECLRIAMMEDDQLLDALNRSPRAEARYLSCRIRNMRPYHFVAKWANQVFTDHSNLIGEKREHLNTYLKSHVMEEQEPEILAYAEAGFWQTPKNQPIAAWLNPKRLMVEGEPPGTSLSDHVDHKADLDHLANAEQLKFLWIFARDEDRRISIEHQVDGILKTRVPPGKSDTHGSDAENPRSSDSENARSL